MLKKGGINMNDKYIMKLADMLSEYSYKIDATIDLLIEKNVFSRSEINNMLNVIIEKKKMEPLTDEYVIDELKDNILLK
jgi:hypothetical protein